jgi:hypothetical protein
MSKRVPKADRTLNALRLGRIAAANPERQLEMRVSTDERFHDRCLLHEDGLARPHRASVNSLDTRMTAAVPPLRSNSSPARSV